MSNGYVDIFERNGTTANMHDTDLRNTIGQANGLAQLDSNGKLPSNQIPSDTTKADKVTNPTDGNLAKLDANGNLADSGIASNIFPSGASSSDKLVKSSENNFKYTNLNGDYDFNTLITTGVYSVYVTDIAAQNSPPRTGWFQVYTTLAADNSNYIQQLAVFQEGDMYIRVMNNGTWFAWDSLVKQTELNGIVKRSDFINSTDLNTLLYSGIYPLGQYNTHTPNDGDYNFTYCTLYVCGNGSAGVASQILIDRNSNVWTRRLLNGAWNGWQSTQQPEVSGVSIMLPVNDYSMSILLRKPEGMTRYCCRLLVCNQGDAGGAGFTGDYFIGVNAYGERIYELTGIQGAASATITRQTDDPNYVVVEFSQTAIWANAILTGPKDYIT